MNVRARRPGKTRDRMPSGPQLPAVDAGEGDDDAGSGGDGGDNPVCISDAK